MLLFGLMLGLILGAAAPTAAASQVKDPNAQARGRVLEAGTNAPISGARVVFAFRGRSRLQTVTDENGRYAFAELEPGPWRLTVQKVGYVPLDPATIPTVWLVAGQALELPTASLQKPGTIAGRVFDPAGEPLVGVHVRVVRRGAPNDVRAPAGGTNERGEFRIFGLAPGEYLVGGSRQPFELPSTFYPGTSDASAAEAIKITAGRTVEGVTIVLRRVQ